MMGSRLWKMLLMLPPFKGGSTSNEIRVFPLDCFKYSVTFIPDWMGAKIAKLGKLKADPGFAQIRFGLNHPAIGIANGLFRFFSFEVSPFEGFKEFDPGHGIKNPLRFDLSVVVGFLGLLSEI